MKSIFTKTIIFVFLIKFLLIGCVPDQDPSQKTNRAEPSQKVKGSGLPLTNRIVNGRPDPFFFLVKIKSFYYG